jgi:MFS family permease
VSVAIAGFVVAFGVSEQPRMGRSLTVPPEGVTEFQRDSPGAVARAATAALRDEADTAAAIPREPTARPVTSLVNRLLIAAIVLNFGAFFAGGTWEVIWSLFMQAKGASIEFIGFTFALFSLPVLIVSPLVGRMVDRRGPLPFLIIGSLGAVVTGIAYTLTDDLVVIAGIVVIEALGWALVNPALYAVVAAGSPPGRSSTAQGVFGTSGTLAYIVSSILAGRLLATDLRYPFYLLVTVVFVTLVLALLIAGRSRLATTAEPARLDVATAPTGG